MNPEKRKKILLVEDEFTAAALETLMLKNYGFDVVAAADGEKAVELVVADPSIDLVLMDINLGDGIDGTEAAENILKLREVPIVFLSSHTGREVVEKTEGITSYGYIVKGSGETVIIASVKMAFRLFESRMLERHKEEALRAEKEFNRNLVKLSPAFFVAIGSDGRVTMMNDSMLSALGYSPDEVCGLDYMSAFVPEADREELSAIFERIIELRQATVNINRVRTRGCRVLTCEWRGIPVFQGEIYDFFLGVGIDITDRVRAEKEAREHEVFRNRVFESSRLPIIVMDAETCRYIDCNAAAAKIYGFSGIEEIIGRAPLDFSAPVQYDGTPSSEKARYYIEKALRDGFAVFDWRHRRPDGAGWDAEVHLMSFLDGGKDYLQFTLIDMTDRKKAENELKISRAELEESENRYREILETSPIGIFQRKLEGAYTYANQTLIEQSECETFEEFVERYSDISGRWTDFKKIDEFKKLLFEEGKALGFEVRSVLLSGTEKYFMLFAYLDESGGVVNGFSLDITAQKRAEEELERSRRKLESSLVEKEALLRELYHRTKNNMQVICAMLAIHSAQIGSRDIANIFKEVETKIRVMALVHQKLYKSENLSNISLKEYIIDLCSLLKKSYNVSPDRIELELDIEEISVTIDIAIPCGLVLNELFSNTFKYAFPGNASGKVRLSVAKAPGCLIEFNYGDDGAGPPEGFDCRRDGKMGLQSVISIIENQLQGSISFSPGGGFKCVFRFSDSVYKARL